MSLDVFPLIATERRRSADVLESLPPGAWDAPSLCKGWTLETLSSPL